MDIEAEFDKSLRRIERQAERRVRESLERIGYDMERYDHQRREELARPWRAIGEAAKRAGTALAEALGLVSQRPPAHDGRPQLISLREVQDRMGADPGPTYTPPMPNVKRGPTYGSPAPHISRGPATRVPVSGPALRIELTEGEYRALFKLRELGVEDATERMNHAVTLEAAGVTADMLTVFAKIAASGRVATEDLYMLGSEGVTLNIFGPNILDAEVRAVVRHMYGPHEPAAWEMSNAREALQAARDARRLSHVR